MRPISPIAGMAISPGWRPDQPWNDLPRQPPALELKQAAGLMPHPAMLINAPPEAIGIPQKVQSGKEKLFIHPKLLRLLTQDSNTFPPYAEARPYGRA